jgi:hypothetical protein
VFELNDLSNVKPPPGAFGPDEAYLGPVFDESAIRFFLVFNRKLKLSTTSSTRPSRSPSNSSPPPPPTAY